MKLQRVTFTGVDTYTNLDELVSLSKEFPFVEWGFLLSLSSKDNPRYMELDRIELFVKELLPYSNISLHICGKAVPLALNYAPILYNILELVMSSSHNRIQLNFAHSHGLVSIPLLQWFINKSKIPVITQVNENNRHVSKLLNPSKNCQYLFDSSGGNGETIVQFPKPLKLFDQRRLEEVVPICGYAGGIDKGNLFNVLGHMSGILDTDYNTWIDMESSVRLENYFRPEYCKEILQEIAATKYV